MSRSDVDTVMAYIVKQKNHHTENMLWDDLEEIDEEVTASSSEDA